MADYQPYITGWVKLWRKLHDNPYMQRPAYRSVWIELLITAEHGKKFVDGKWIDKTQEELHSVIWKGARIRLQPGQLCIGMKQLAQWTGVARTTVQNILETFKNEQQIGLQTSNRFSLITVNKWYEYQMDGHQNGLPVGFQWASSGPTPKNVKNDNNILATKVAVTSSSESDESSLEGVAVPPPPSMATATDSQPPKDAPVFDSAAYVASLCEQGKPKHIRVIGWYWQRKSIVFPTLKAAQYALKRLLRVASEVAEYSADEANDVVDRLEQDKFWKSQWTLEHVLTKLINQA